ncbi:hypothetical protein FEK33_26090 [Nocardia asteroides NBRC 15531]|uniref:Uncharacterized protein n=1 Tax=Nocardia asteroides NBRC 15531 TaxID=1110697 RepID=U5ELM2_NOCAS|nr:hypothetical protein [Nocardia asteroides]TLF63482.1 hypothetical protein FEK33_26090 [Nocardia asteroides NBRC 15531]UGT47070.1 hypothetical protein LT345_21425 [Nocardia asteroides]SFM80442.1 hypothetical protein SAMN05444423_104290 [Nocardia asteroides]VEG34055.1 Uncharacterised protein [Nocardia asteroides]GAD87213.1 hypothetical protein NCAST_34_03430 [Nocardia asteroides NBRC 15531]
MLTVYANQTVVRGDDLAEVVRAAEILGIGLKIENVMVPDEDGGYSAAWIVTREDEVPLYEEWDGRYEDLDEDEEQLAAVGE